MRLLRNSILLIFLLFEGSALAWFQDNYYEAIDSLSALTENSSGTTEGLHYAEQLMDVANKAGNREVYDYAVGQKLNMLSTLGRYDECIGFADSIVARADTNSYQAYFAQFVKTIAFIDLGRFKSAIQLAQSLYDGSKKPIFDTSGEDVSVRVRCNALMGLGLANNEMDREATAIKNFSEAIDLIPKDDSANLTMRLDLQTYRMQSAQHLSDRSVALTYVSTYERELKEFRESVQGNEVFENLFIEDYSLLMEVAFVDVLTDLKRFDEAAAHIEKADMLLAEYPSLVGLYVAELNSVKSKYYEATGEYGLAVTYADLALTYYSECGRRSNEITVLKTKLRATHALKLYYAEYPLTERIMTLLDSVYRQRYASQIQDMQTIMDVDKLQNEKVQFEQRAALFSAQRQLWIFVSISILLGATAVFTLFKRRRDKERQRILSNQKQMLEEEVDRQTKQLREQNTAIENANKVLAENNEKIEKQNIEITDSINYAFKIQKSILPNLSFFKGRGNGGCFAFYVPCHIVSGDFYWARSKNDVDMIVCADCTGHGVPGAFMTMIGTTILNDIFDHKDNVAPHIMLENLHSNLINILQQSGDENSKDGMDLAVLRFDHSTNMVSIASAKRPVYLYKAGEQEGIELKEAMVKRSIGDRDYNVNNLPFCSIEFEVNEGDTIYMSSDGLADLFGGPKKKRFMTKRVVEMMNNIVGLPIEQQHEKVHEAYKDWLTDCGRLPESEWDQLDDVSFMGVRF